VLVIAEVALACALLVASALLVRSVKRMMEAPTGVVTDGVVTATIQLEAAKYPRWPDVEQFYTALLENVRRQPGIEVAGVANAIALEQGWRLPFAVEGRPPARQDEAPIAQIVNVSSGYFETLRARLIAGRFFAEREAVSTEPVVVINETMARRTFPGENPLDRRIVSTAQQIGPLGRNSFFTSPDVKSVSYRIVGVVADVHQAAIGRASEPVIYHAFRQFPFRSMTLVARGPSTAAVTTGLREALRSIDPAIPLGSVRTMSERLVLATAAPRLLMGVLSTFAILTGLLAAIGVYGLMAWTVNDRRRELAIRLALGAQPGSLARLVTTHGLGLAGAGVIIGLAGAQLARGLLQTVLFRTTTTDTASIACAAGLLIVAAGVACLAPARRAARVAPVEGLKET
jgi:putative ABC transport system permease protein